MQKKKRQTLCPKLKGKSNMVEKYEKRKKCKVKAMQIKKDHPKEGVILKVF
jgi:hypothetical protein